MSETIQVPIKQYRETEENRSKLERENRTLRRFLEDLFDKLIGFMVFLWVCAYAGAVAWSWYWLDNRPQAVTIVLSLTVAHASIGFHNYLKRKRKELTDR